MFALGFAGGVFFSFVWGAVLLTRRALAKKELDKKIEEVLAARAAKLSTKTSPENRPFIN